MAKFLNKKSCIIGKDVKFGKNVIIYPNNVIEGDTFIDDDCMILEGNNITDCNIGKNCKIHKSVLEKSEIHDQVTIGPFARIRPNSIIKSGCRIGNFVEIKNSIIGQNCKISHLAYVGDCEMGKDCNIGCGAIFVNYNGKTKSKCLLGNHVFIGSNCNIIAPVKIEDESFVCAGTTVTDNVESGDFVIGRARQENKKNRAKKDW